MRILNLSRTALLQKWSMRILNFSRTALLQKWNMRIFNLSRTALLQKWNMRILNLSRTALLQKWNMRIFNLSRTALLQKQMYKLVALLSIKDMSRYESTISISGMINTCDVSNYSDIKLFVRKSGGDIRKVCRSTWTPIRISKSNAHLHTQIRLCII